MEALGINLGFFIVQVLNFVILAVVLYAWAYKPILQMLDERKAKIAQGLEDARVAGEAKSKAQAEADKIIANAQAEVNRKITEATQRAEVAAREVTAAAEAEKAKILKGAADDAEAERARVLGDLRSQVSMLALAAAQQVIGDVLKKDEKYAHSLVEEFFSGVKGGKVTVLEGVTVSGASAEVTSALPLNADEQSSVKKSLAGATNVTFRVDPNILGGLVVRVGDRIVDGSARSKLEGLRQSVK